MMKETRILMGMPVTIEVVDAWVTQATLNSIFGYFEYVDATFSTYKETSEITRLNKYEITLEQASEDVQTIFALAQETRNETDGYFDIELDGYYDPSGLVKGWAIYNASQILHRDGFRNYYVDAGGDIQAAGKNSQGEKWRVGIRNPFNINEIVKVLAVSNCGVATSGTSIRGQHIYNPKRPAQTINDIISLTVIGQNIYEADRFATAAFAMGYKGIDYIEHLNGFEGYLIDTNGIATLTSGFARYSTDD